MSTISISRVPPQANRVPPPANWRRNPCRVRLSCRRAPVGHAVCDKLWCAPVLVRDRGWVIVSSRSEEHTSELQSLAYLVCRLLLEKKKNLNNNCKNLSSCPLLFALLHPDELHHSYILVILHYTPNVQRVLILLDRVIIGRCKIRTP